MRALAFTTLAFVSAVALTACASTGREGATSSGYSDTARLQRECDRRGGMLIPTGRNTGEPALDNSCDVTNGNQAPPPRGP